MRLIAKSVVGKLAVAIGVVSAVATSSSAFAQQRDAVTASINPSEPAVGDSRLDGALRPGNAPRTAFNAAGTASGGASVEGVITPAAAPATTGTAVITTDQVFFGSSIVGTVHEPSGVVMAGVELTIREVTGDKTKHTTSNASGAFGFSHLSPGSYQILAIKNGFNGVNTTVVLGAHRQLHADLWLKAPTADENTAAPATSTTTDSLGTLAARVEQLETELVALRAQPLPPPQNAPPPAPAVDDKTPFAFGDFTWLNGSPRNKKVAFDSPWFTPEVRFDTNYMDSLNHPVDHTLGGSTESFRSDEIQVEQASVGGDFHLDNVRGRILFMMGEFATTTPRNDASAGVGQWDLRDAYRYVSEAYGGYHFDVQHGLNVDAGIFVSYIGLFSYYNFDNWTYQPSYVSSNTPWFFNGLRVQWFPTNKLKIEPWIINGWQSYATFNNHLSIGGQVLYQPTENLKLVFNNYGPGQDTLSNPLVNRIHTDDSIEYRYYNNPVSTGISKMAFSLTADAGCQYGGGSSCTGNNGTKAQNFLGWMLYNRFWFNKDLFALTIGGGQMSNPGRYLTLLPPINGADAVSGSPYFTENPGDPAYQWDTTVNLQVMPTDFITFWGEVGYRHSNIPYWTGPNGITPPGGNNGSPANYVCSTGATAGTNNLTAAEAACGGGQSSVWFPDLVKSQTTISMGIMVKF